SVIRSLWINKSAVITAMILSAILYFTNIKFCIKDANIAIPTAAVIIAQTISIALASVISRIVGFMANINGRRSAAESYLKPCTPVLIGPAFAIPAVAYAGRLIGGVSSARTP